MRQNSVGTTKIEPAINLSLSGSHLQFTIEPPAKLSDLPIQQSEKFNLSVPTRCSNKTADFPCWAPSRLGLMAALWSLYGAEPTSSSLR
jgi:hypothetical protein